MLCELYIRNDADGERNFSQFTAHVHDFNQQMKKGKLLYESVMKSIDTMMPDELRDDTRNAVEACKTVSVGIKDTCEASFILLKCIYKENPNFFFP